MSTEATSGAGETQSTANSGAGTNTEGTSQGSTAAPQGGSKSEAGQAAKTYTQADLDAQAAEFRKKHEREINALKNQGKPIEERLQEAEKRLKELEPKAELADKLHADLSNEVKARIGKLPETHRPAESVLNALPITEQRALLAQLEKVAGYANAGPIQSPGGNVGTRTAGIDVAAIVAGMDNGDPKLYNEALKSINQAELTKLVVEYRGRKR